MGPDTERVEETEFLLLVRLRGSGVFDARLPTGRRGARNPVESLPRDNWAYELLFLLAEEPI